MRTEEITTAERAPNGTIALILGLLLVLTPGRSVAAPVSGIAGYDHYSGPLGQRTDGIVGAVVLGVGEGDVLVGGSRYDDTLIGRGYGLTGGFGLPFRPGVHLRASGTRYLGDGPFRAWRIKAGPEFGLSGEGKLTLSYSRYEDNADATSDGMIAEATAPLAGALTWRAGGSAATAPSGPRAVQGSVGISWTLRSHVAISGDVGLARGAAGANGQPVPGHGGLLDGLPLIGGGGGGGSAQQDAERKVAGTLLLGVRVWGP